MFNGVFGKIIRFFFYGNYFYGICAIILCAGSASMLRLPKLPPYFHAIVFLGTVIFYTQAYLAGRSGYPNNERDIIYRNNIRTIGTLQLCHLILFVICIYMTRDVLLKTLQTPDLLSVSLLLLFPISALCYYGFGRTFNLRSFGSLKPFIIGFCWSGTVTAYPLSLSHIQSGTELSLNTAFICLFISNFLFVSILCIMFDIRDTEGDKKNSLKTFSVTQGPNRTIRSVILPLIPVGLMFELFPSFTPQPDFTVLLILILPYLLLIPAAFSLMKKRSLLYYLIFIDGLMLLKGLSGMLSPVV